jgi:hypothetical protein
MPPVNQSSSRTALLTWTVISVVLAGLSTILAVYFYLNATGTTETLQGEMRQLQEVITPDVQRAKGEEIAALKAYREDPANNLTANVRLFDVALTQRDTLAKLMSGSTQGAAAVTAAKGAIERAKAAGASPANDSLIETINALVTELDARRSEAENNRKDSEASKAKLAASTEETNQQIARINAEMEKLRQEKDGSLEQVARVTDEQSTNFERTASDLRTQIAGSNEQVAAMTTQNAELGAQIQRMAAEIARLRDRLGDRRADPNRAVLAQSDGQIVRVPGGGVCYINLGSGDRITPGLTFEVYDKLDGIPAPGDPTNDLNLPAGKASIEVVKVVGPGTAECRITRQQIGSALSEGDIIANIVYDRYVTNRFVVFGNFNIDGNGASTPQDAEIIKRLITQWGGEMMDDINADTDFVVLGKEPVVPEKPDSEDPLQLAQYNESLAQSDRFRALAGKAIEYRLPVLNQNRFLYLVGYFTQARR